MSNPIPGSMNRKIKKESSTKSTSRNNKIQLPSSQKSTIEGTPSKEEPNENDIDIKSSSSSLSQIFFRRRN